MVVVQDQVHSASLFFQYFVQLRWIFIILNLMELNENNMKLNEMEMEMDWNGMK